MCIHIYTNTCIYIYASGCWFKYTYRSIVYMHITCVWVRDTHSARIYYELKTKIPAFLGYSITTQGSTRFCSVLQCVVMCCSVLWCTALCCIVCQCVALCACACHSVAACVLGSLNRQAFPQKNPIFRCNVENMALRRKRLNRQENPQSPGLFRQRAIFLGLICKSDQSKKPARQVIAAHSYSFHLSQQMCGELQGSFAIGDCIVWRIVGLCCSVLKRCHVAWHDAWRITGLVGSLLTSFVALLWNCLVFRGSFMKLSRHVRRAT